MSRRAIRMTTALALLALASGAAISLLMSGAGGANAFSRGIGIASDAAPNQYAARCSNGTVVPNPSSNPGLVKDCATLLSIRATIDPEHWLGGWSGSHAITNTEYWRGVTVSGSPSRVTRLNLRYLPMNGTLPTKLGDLDALTYLRITGNGNSRLSGNGSSNLTGTIPAELGKLSNLTELHLSGNRLTGSIPSKLGDLSKLTTLNLAYNELSGSVPSELGNIPNFRLYIDRNRLTGCIPTSLRRPVGLSQGSWQGTRSGSADSYLLRYCAAATATPTPSATPTPTPTPSATATPTPTPSATPTTTGTPPTVIEGSHTPTATPSATATSISAPPVVIETSPTATRTTVPAATPRPTRTPIPTAAPADIRGRLSVLERHVAEIANLERRIESQAVDMANLKRQVESQAAENASLERRLGDMATRLARLEDLLANRPAPATATPTPSATPTRVAGIAPTATATPSPTATRTTAPAADACVQALAGAGRVNGRWVKGDCVSTHSPVNDNTYYARFYTFTLDAAAEVTVALATPDHTPGTFLIAPYIYLLEGAGKDGSVIETNGAPNTVVAKISRRLQAGRYTIEATTFDPRIVSDFTLDLMIAR